MENFWFGDGDGDGIFSHRFKHEHMDTTCCALNYLTCHQRKGDHLTETLRLRALFVVQEKSTGVSCLGWDEYFPMMLEKFSGVVDDMCLEGHILAFERGVFYVTFIDEADGKTIEESTLLVRKVTLLLT